MRHHERSVAKEKASKCLRSVTIATACLGNITCIAAGLAVGAGNKIVDDTYARLSPKLAMTAKNTATTAECTLADNRCTLAFKTKSGSFVTAIFVDPNSNGLPDVGELRSVNFGFVGVDSNHATPQLLSSGKIEKKENPLWFPSINFSSTSQAATAVSSPIVRSPSDILSFKERSAAKADAVAELTEYILDQVA